MKSIVIQRSGGSGKIFAIQPTLLSGIKINTKKDVNKILLCMQKPSIGIGERICFWANNNIIDMFNIKQIIHSKRNVLHVEHILTIFEKNSIKNGFFCAKTSGILGIQQYIVSSKDTFYRVVRDIKTGAWGTDHSLQHKGDLIGICKSSETLEHLVTSRPNDPAYPYFVTVKWDTCLRSRTLFKFHNGYDPAPPNKI